MIRRIHPIVLTAIVLLWSGAAGAQWTFTDVSATAGIAAYSHEYPNGYDTEAERIAAGAAAADVDGDGLLDLYLLRGPGFPNVLLRNLGDGTFAPFPTQPTPTPLNGCGATFADLDGDGWVDLLTGGMLDGFDVPPTKLLRNTGGGVFVEEVGALGGSLMPGYPVFSFAAGDVDRDGDLDLACTHWTHVRGLTLLQNDGGMSFSDVTLPGGVYVPSLFGFAPNFADIDADGWIDLLVSGDFSTSEYFHNDGDGSFTRAVDPVIDDENGMGAAVGDYDNDGHLDWFVSSIWDPDQEAEGSWGLSGNRLYRNLGDGSFEDVTEAAGVREGWWGWGSCFADFNNDGRLDIFHVNGWSTAVATDFHDDPSRLFVGQPGGTFSEESAARGIVDTRQGRGLVCFDYDRDGDVDILIANNSAPPRLYRNDGGNDNHWLTVRLSGTNANTQGIGARVQVTAGGATQVREIRAGNNFASSNPSEAYFGLGTSTTIDELRVDWPAGGTTVLSAVSVDQTLTVSASPSAPPPVPDGGPNPGSPLVVEKLDPLGNDLRVSWDPAGCPGAGAFRLLYGRGSTLPTSVGGVYGIDGSVCGLDNSGLLTWSGTPNAAAEPSRLVWWLVVASDGGVTEGSWGLDSFGGERRGPGPSGVSGECGATVKDVTTGCAP